MNYYLYAIINNGNNRRYYGWTNLDPRLFSFDNLTKYASYSGLMSLHCDLCRFNESDFEVRVCYVSTDKDEIEKYWTSLKEEHETDKVGGYNLGDTQLIPMINLQVLESTLAKVTESSFELGKDMDKLVEEANQIIYIPTKVGETTMSAGEWVELTCNPTPDKTQLNPYDLIITATKLLKEMQQAYLRDDYSTIMEVYKDFSQYVEVDTKLDDVMCDLLIDAKDEIINLMDNLEF